MATGSGADIESAVVAILPDGRASSLVERGSYPALLPPSTASAAPVTNEAASELR